MKPAILNPSHGLASLFETGHPPVMAPDHRQDCGAQAADPPITADIDGSHLRVIEKGPDLLAALMALIEGAEASLKLYYYIFAADRSGTHVRDALIAARARGVQVVLMVDAFGAAGTPRSFFQPLEAAGARFGFFGASRSTRYLIRNHQKIAIADDARLLIGGFNVADDYFGQPSDNCWHDVGLTVEGAAVAPMVRWFHLIETWVFARKQRFGSLRRLVRAWRPGEGALGWLVGGPTRFLSPWAKQVKHDLERATRLDMIEAYFSPGRGMLRRIGRAAWRGHRAGPGETSGGARLILPSRSDNSATVAASRFLYGGMLRRGVTLYEYLPCRLHMKLIVVDDIVYIGSANFDMRSLFLNLELMLRIQDAGFAEKMRRLVDARADDSLAITTDVQRQRRGLWSILTGSLSYLLVGVLDYTVTRRLNFRRVKRPA